MKTNAARQGVRLSYNVSLRRTVSWTGTRKTEVRNGGCERTVGEIDCQTVAARGQKQLTMGLGPSDLTRKE